MPYEPVKRAIDVAVSVSLLVVLAPVIAAVAILVRVFHGSPVLFAQRRPGLDGELFTIYKFRSMRDGPGDDADRLTRFGRGLRSTSLDELPSLWNVARGDMSLVGPRPLLVEYLDRYNPRQATRHRVRPGITGLAQVNGRNAVSWEDRLELDAVYVESASLMLDLRILAQTIGSVLRREGISEEGGATMSKFQGSIER